MSKYPSTARVAKTRKTSPDPDFEPHTADICPHGTSSSACETCVLRAQVEFLKTRPVSVWCVELSHPEGVETEAICKTEAAALEYVAKQHSGFVKKTSKTGYVYWQCSTYWEHTLDIRERKVLENGNEYEQEE